MVRAARWIAAAVVGIAAGWFGRGWFDPGARGPVPAVAPGPAAGEERGGPGLAARPGDGATPSAAVPAPPPAPLLSARIAKASPSDLVEIANSKEKPTFDAAAVDALLVRLKQSVEAGDSNLFRVVLRLLGQADDPRGDAALVALLADPGLELPRPIGNDFHDALANSAALGIAAAARARRERAKVGEEQSWIAFAGWYDLVARHGTAEDLDWLVADAESSRGGARFAMQALGRSARPEAGPLMRRLVARAGPQPDLAEGIGALAKDRPEDAFRLAREDADAGKPGPLERFAASAPEGSLALAEDYVRGVTAEDRRIQLVRVVEALHRRGRDLTGLSAVVDAPILFLERIAAGEPISAENRPLLGPAGYAVEYSRVTWSERAARALESADARLKRDGIDVGGPDYVKVAKTVRDGLASRWK